MSAPNNDLYLVQVALLQATRQWVANPSSETYRPMLAAYNQLFDIAGPSFAFPDMHFQRMVQWLAFDISAYRGGGPALDPVRIAGFLPPHTYVVPAPIPFQTRQPPATPSGPAVAGSRATSSSVFGGARPAPTSVLGGGRASSVLGGGHPTPSPIVPGGIRATSSSLPGGLIAATRTATPAFATPAHKASEPEFTITGSLTGLQDPTKYRRVTPEGPLPKPPKGKPPVEDTVDKGKKKSARQRDDGDDGQDEPEVPGRNPNKRTKRGTSGSLSRANSASEEAWFARLLALMGLMPVSHAAVIMLVAHLFPVTTLFQKKSPNERHSEPIAERRINTNLGVGGMRGGPSPLSTSLSGDGSRQVTPSVGTPVFAEALANMDLRALHSDIGTVGELVTSNHAATTTQLTALNTELAALRIVINALPGVIMTILPGAIAAAMTNTLSGQVPPPMPDAPIIPPAVPSTATEALEERPTPEENAGSDDELAAGDSEGPQRDIDMALSG
ncbi:hypothetical protein BDN72DRAFT_905451 [Pluteus cervinus]|uniref:Uncharacterized protein n=1 Tax=Pluteus cervinus TaxID=181527 RepID=A0ACD3A4X2_9AGAR|nr:hypothetical protein BDN72DRAFT_905451 [Pluteus cervinus]